MARKSKRRGGRRAKSIPIAVVAPLIAPAVMNSVPKLMAGDFKGFAASLAQEYTGVNPDGSFNAKQIGQWVIPTLIGVVVHKGANKMGVNAHVRRLTMGYLSI